MVVLGLVIALPIVWVASLNRTAWESASKLSTALHNPRSVTLREYAGRTTMAQRTATPDEIARLRTSTGIWFCDFKPRGALCFEPHHAVEVVRADGSQLNFAVCFLCQGFLLVKEPFHEGDTFFYAPLPSFWEKSLTSFFTSVGMKPKTHEEYTAIEATSAKKEPES